MWRHSPTARQSIHHEREKSSIRGGCAATPGRCLGGAGGGRREGRGREREGVKGGQGARAIEHEGAARRARTPAVELLSSSSCQLFAVCLACVERDVHGVVRGDAGCLAGGGRSLRAKAR